MRIDLSLMGTPVDTTGSAARVEAAGFDGIWVAETSHDPFLALGLAATATTRVALGTNIAVAFARSPMTVATTANDLQTLSGGRLILGLGSQVRPHITRRFSMPWSAPADRMREYVQALRAIWGSWATGEPLHFAGEFYTHTLMTPMFDPGPNPSGPPAVHLAAVGPRMTEVAGAVADGMLCHPFTTVRYLREVTLPSLERGRGDLAGFDVCGVPLIVTGRDPAEQARRAEQARGQLAFYASTPAYRPVLDLHGWGDLHDLLRPMAREGRWAEMGAHIDDTMLRTLAVVAEPDRVAEEVHRRFGGIWTRCALALHPGEDPEMWTSLRQQLRPG